MFRALVVITVLAGALWGVSQTFRVEAQQSVDAMQSAAISGAVFDAPGAWHGYVLPQAGEFQLGEFTMREIEVSPPDPECDMPGFMRLTMQRGEEEMIQFEVEAYRVDADGFLLRARSEEAGLLLIDGVWADGALETYQSGVDVMQHLMTARVMLGSEDAQSVDFAFWIGD